MAATWSDALRRVAEALGRRRRIAEGEGEATRDQGFTLIELMVVLLIMGILMAIAIPTFLGVTKGANDKAPQSNLVNEMTAAKAVYSQTNGYPVTATIVTKLNKENPGIKATTKGSNTPHVVSVLQSSATKLAMASWSKSDVCWVAVDTEATGGLKYGFLHAASKATTATTKTTATNCTATKATGATIHWTTSGGFPTTKTGK